MSEALFLLVRLRVPDVTALTAEETIRKRVAGGGRLVRLDRLDLWEFRHRDGAAFREKLDALVRDSNLFVNPNKHAYRITGDYRRGWREGGYLVLVRGREDLEGKVAEETLARRYAIDGLHGVRYGVLWRMKLEGTGGAEGLALAESLAVTRAPKGGLLVNPHVQTWSVEAAVESEEAEE
ncbi:MAG: hypothetical protein JW958_07825 [Candidatus Eisenbacteria bacterium]|nr:hypothetical protein [Candidatus Eisenbacteria bacterium]